MSYALAVQPVFNACQGYEFREAVDGQEGVRIFENDGYFE